MERKSELNVAEKLKIGTGILSVIGSGGKTTFLGTLARELPGQVILCTTTHIRPFLEYPLVFGEDEAIRALEHDRVICVGEWGEEGKLTAPRIPFDRLTQLASYVLVEADGSRRLPIKGHAPHEPVIPPESERTICIVGASGFGKTIGQAVHRPEIFCRLTERRPEETVTPEVVAQGILREGLTKEVMINQVEDDLAWDQAGRFARELEGAGITLWAGSLRQDTVKKYGPDGWR